MQVTRINNDYSNKYNQRVAFKQVLENRIKTNPKLIQAIKDKKFLLLVSGPSGVGKDTVMARVMDLFNKIVTHTTRPMRKGEVDGESYFFTTLEKFLDGIKNNKFVEYVQLFAGRYYGTKRETIEKALDGKKPALAIVDVDGAKNIREALKNDPQINVVSIFFAPPSSKILKERLQGRDPNMPIKEMQERLDRAEYEMKRAKEYDAVIAFENPEDGVKDVKELLYLD